MNRLWSIVIILAGLGRLMSAQELDESTNLPQPSGALQIQAAQLARDAESLKTENEKLKTENEKLKIENQNENLRSENEKLKTENEKLKIENDKLREKLAEASTPPANPLTGAGRPKNGEKPAEEKALVDPFQQGSVRVGTRYPERNKSQPFRMTISMRTGDTISGEISIKRADNKTTNYDFKGSVQGGTKIKFRTAKSGSFEQTFDGSFESGRLKLDWLGIADNGSRVKGNATLDQVLK